uniref:Uncharacterized protein n=1 Tax=Moniliophthora roreri TaxID=221103 RepID=A0A0W0G124_MONRR
MDIRWKYNIQRHLIDCHGKDWHTFVSQAFLEKARVTEYAVEEKRDTF